MFISMKNHLQNTIHWINVAYSSQQDGVEATIHPVSHESDTQCCFGVTVENKWVIGTDGALSVFDSLGAARRFLKLLGFHRINWHSSSKFFSAPQHRGYQLYRLRGQQLRAGAKPFNQYIE